MTAKPDPTAATEAQSGPVPGIQEDAGYVVRALAGDEGAFRALYDQWRPLVFRVVRGFASFNRDDVEDVVQDAFVRAFGRLDRLQDPARFGPWILTIARNCALSRLARGKAALEMADGLAREIEVHGEATAELPDTGAEAELELVRRIVEELPEGPEKETVHLFYVEGKLSAREIAERLGVGKSAVTMRLERFRTKVKRRLLAEVAKLRGEES